MEDFHGEDAMPGWWWRSGGGVPKGGVENPEVKEGGWELGRGKMLGCG